MTDERSGPLGPDIKEALVDFRGTDFASLLIQNRRFTPKSLDLIRSLRSSYLAFYLKVNEYPNSVSEIIALKNAGVFQNVPIDQGHAEYAWEHLVIAGLTFVYLGRGYNYGEAHDQISKLGKGTTLLNFLSYREDLKNPQKKDHRSIFSDQSPWLQLPIPYKPTPTVNKTEETPAEQKSVPNPEEVREQENQKIANFLEYLKALTSKDKIATAREWNLSRLSSNYHLIDDPSKDLTKITMTYGLIKMEIARFIVWVGESKSKTYRDPIALSANINLSQFLECLQKTIAYLIRNPEIKNLWELVIAIEKSLIRKKQETANPQVASEEDIARKTSVTP